MNRPMSLYTALVTPFDADGSLKLDALPALFDFQRKAGITGIVLAGTNGEGTSLSVEERVNLLACALDHAGDLDIIAGTGASSVSDAVALTRDAARRGARAALVLPPFYYPNPPMEGLVAYYEAVARSADIPIILYSIPQFSGIAIDTVLLDRLRHLPNISGIKESSGDSRASVRILNERPDIDLYIGSDPLLAELLAAGAKGVISGSANAYPELLVAVASAIMCGEDPHPSQTRLNQMIDVLTSGPLVGLAKAILQERGIGGLHVRPPLRMPTHDEWASALMRLDELGLTRIKPASSSLT